MDEREQLVITLKSDMCVGSGYSYAGIVDSDVCYDECGLPYIPAKRLKGCLREAAGLIGLSTEQTNRLFGESGQNNASGVFLGNAYMEGYESLYEELKHIEESLKGYLTPQNVLDRFTTIKAQTKIMENGVAQDNSLRYIRTVNHYSPLDREQELCFAADVYYEDLKEDDKKAFENTVKALRNIGLNRSRGLGSVKCELKQLKYSEPSQETEIGFDTIKEEDIYVLSYSVKNLSPLILSANQENNTEKYISGQRVLGYFANAYLKDGGSAQDAEFEELFLKKEVIFGGLYPCSEADGTKERNIYYPAPSYINRLKKTGKYVNVSKEIPITIEECKQKEIEEKYARGEGNQPKKLKQKFVCAKEKGILVKEVESDIVYHHTKKSTKQGVENGELLYAFEVVSKGQCFAGTITGKGKYLKKVVRLLQKGNLQFGKSRSAQYGTCVLNGVPQIKEKISAQAAPKTFRAEKRVLVVLQSDGIFMDDTGYTVRYEQVREQVKEAFGIKEKSDKQSEMYSEIEVKMLTGYYSVWNLKRPAIPAVCAGSTFEFLLGEELTVSEETAYAGERVGEGYGRLAIVSNDGKNCCIEEIKEEEKEQKLQYAKSLCKRILLDEMRERLRRCAVRTKIEMDNPAMLGRITLMLTDSINQWPDDSNEAYKDFCNRIRSIKREKVQEKVKKIKDDLICEGDDLSSKLKYIKIKDLKEVYDVYKKQILGAGEADAPVDDELKKLWSGYLMDVFVQEKYNQKSKEQKNSSQDQQDENKGRS